MHSKGVGILKVANSLGIGTGTAQHLKGASNEPARGAAMTSDSQSPTVCYGALDPPVGVTFHFENHLSKNGSVP